ncbi:hypothetical protein B0J13DRAFT_523200 [Dactylonectria estremocensis]|uniref:Uncharacterized protein n=1 Tax=Dactylonectria estremocensis TaxID=1079267 RepID=A0A9P9J4X6_9HYPO|nr:hypothetical protein B0J13DRAFT_523200 [Dactylonectria estremocensis]
MLANTVVALAGLVALAAAQTPTFASPEITATVAPIGGGSGSGNGNGTASVLPVPITITKVYTAYTTYCPGPTSFEFNGHTYTATEACTLTITDCPCTVVETHGGIKPTSTWGWGSGHTSSPSEQPYICPGGKCQPGASGSGYPPASGSTGSPSPPVVTAGAGAVKVSLGLVAAVAAVMAL